MNLSATLFLSFMLCVMACLGWYFGSAPAVYHMDDRLLLHIPDLTLHQVILHEFDDTGRLSKALTTEKLTHIPHDNQYRLHAPDIHFRDKDKHDWHLTAHDAVAKQGFSTMLFHGQVRLHQATSEQHAGFTMRTESLTYIPKKEQAFTNDPVHFKQVGHQIHAHGMQADLKTNHITLMGAKAFLQRDKHV